MTSPSNLVRMQFLRVIAVTIRLSFLLNLMVLFSDIVHYGQLLKQKVDIVQSQPKIYASDMKIHMWKYKKINKNTNTETLYVLYIYIR